ncbi:MAG: nucleotidyl transferase AbiEii/AbiGii toxin family protein [Candidatus Micrarchaeia archaeon]
MDESFNRKYKKVLEILPDVAECAQGRLILVGGTALALFYLKHRVSVDLDFVPIAGDETKLKEELKGCLSKKGYRTVPGAFRNQFIIQFEDTSIKVEVFEPELKLKKLQEHVFGGTKIRVASLEDILKMKLSAYRERNEARDLFDIFCILKGKGASAMVKKLIKKSGSPKGADTISAMAVNQEDAAAFQKVISDAS